MCESARGVFSSTKPDGMVLREAALKVAGRDGSVYCTEHGMWTQAGDKAAVMPAQTRPFGNSQCYCLLPSTGPATPPTVNELEPACSPCSPFPTQMDLTLRWVLERDGARKLQHWKGTVPRSGLPLKDWLHFTRSSGSINWLLREQR